ncbi:hypothetical protein [Bacillus andreraoultii]|uniref:hypothetical protein n=1 Tax=Bacillus andreraoultii TaxID=1499685 RepID=UPI00053A0DF4|nr:hypothetical protein [Bacillus andreraoultii]
MKKIYSILLFIIIVALVGYSFYYFNQYQIKNNKEDIQKAIDTWFNRETDPLQAVVLEKVQLGDSSSYIVLLQTDKNEMGYAHLIKGWNGRYKIEHSSYGTNLVSYDVINTNKGIFGIIVGENPELKIDHIKVDLTKSSYRFTTNVVKREKFIAYKKLPEDAKKGSRFAELILYDKNGKTLEW